MSEIEVTTAAQQSLLDEFVDGLTPGHHRLMGAPQTSCDLTFAALREAGARLLDHAASAHGHALGAEITRIGVEVVEPLRQENARLTERVAETEAENRLLREQPAGRVTPEPPQPPIETPPTTSAAPESA